LLDSKSVSKEGMFSGLSSLSNSGFEFSSGGGNDEDSTVSLIKRSIRVIHNVPIPSYIYIF
jgi:hypothetical protein